MTKKTKLNIIEGEAQTIPEPEESNVFDIQSLDQIHIFHEYNAGDQKHVPIIDMQKFSKNNFYKQTLPQIQVLELFGKAEKFNKEEQEEDREMRTMVYQAFKDAFDYRLENKADLVKWDIKIIILRNDEYQKIRNLIEENSLGKIHDLILYLIAKIQILYLENIKSLAWIDSLKAKQDIKYEASQLNKLLSQFAKDDTPSNSENSMSQIESISFRFLAADSVLITNKYFIDKIIESMKSGLGGRFRDWRKHLNFFSDMVSQFNEDDLKYRVAIALHKYFEENQIFIKKPNTIALSKELLCIANILEFGLIKVVAKVDAIESESKIKINNIRNYLQRKKLPSYFTYVPHNLDLKMLKIYFDKAFLSAVPIDKTITKYSGPYIIVERFNITHLLAEICHIMECVKFYKSLIGNQFLENLETTLLNESFISFTKFVKDITFENGNHKLATIQYKFLDASRDYQINERQPLLLIEKAITEYYERHPEEFNFDLIASSIRSKKKDGHKIKYLNDFKIQSERFLPQFCSRMHKFLSIESKPASIESKPALNESTPGNFNLIIACILIECSIFNDSLVDENIVVKKVEHWISDVERDNA